MKKIIFYFLSLAALCSFSACSGGGDDGVGNISTQSVTMPAEASIMLVTLDKLGESVGVATPQDSWISVTIMPYTSGAPVVKLSAQANPNTKERKTKVIITTSSQNKMELTVVQKAKSSSPSPSPSGENTIEDTHDVVTDQPAYASQRD